MSSVKENNKRMHALIDAFPDNIISALAIADQHPLTKQYPSFDNVLICGMGGSGIGGKIVSSWVSEHLAAPIQLCHDYTIPNYVNERTLIIASSNSGNTEETLIAAEAARVKGATVIGICSGGLLQSFCTKWGFECIIVPGDNPPRTTLAFSLVQLIHIFVELKMIPGKVKEDFLSAKKLLDQHKNELQQEAQQLAKFLQNKHVIVYSASQDEGIAVRARQQYNENSKMLCHHHVIPEMNHNELVGWYGGNDHFAVLSIETNNWHPQNLKRLQFVEKFITMKTPYFYHLKAVGVSQIEQSLYLIHLIDWSSLYLAELNDVDSIDISVIDDLKKLLLS